QPLRSAINKHESSRESNNHLLLNTHSRLPPSLRRNATDRSESCPAADSAVISVLRQCFQLRKAQCSRCVVAIPQLLMKRDEQRTCIVVDRPQTRDDDRHACAEERPRETDDAFAVHDPAGRTIATA